MQENEEYCDNQEFFVSFLTETWKLWQCRVCTYTFTQALSDMNPVVIPTYHPQPIPIYFTVSQTQKARIRAYLEEEKEETIWMQND